MSTTRSPLRSARALPKRDQVESEFTLILQQVVAETPSARAAALFDEEGETVDYAGWLDPFDIRIVAAHCQIMLAELREVQSLPELRQLRIRANGAAYVIVALDTHYSLVVITHPRGPFAVSPRVLDDAERRLAAEAGIELSPSATSWFRVEVEVEDVTRVAPQRVRPAISGHGAESAWYGLDILGCLVGLRPGEEGFRVRLDTGMEANLVRERTLAWFVDEPIA